MQTTEFKILLVDDNAHDRDLASLVLGQKLKDSRIFPVGDALEFAEHLKAGDFNVVITERRCDWADDDRILHSLRRHYPRCPVILFTHKRKNAPNGNAGRGYDGYVAKSSAGFLKLADTVERALRPAAEETVDPASLAPPTDHLPVGVFSIDAQGRLHYANTRARSILGLADNAGELPELPELIDEETARDRLRDAIRRNQAINDLDTRIVGHPGNGWVRISLWQAGNGPAGHAFEGVITDISAYRRVVTKLTRNAEDLQRSNTALERFAYVASHDLQEPLSYITRYANLFNDRYDLDDDANQYLKYIVENSERLQSMVDDILAYSRVGTRGNRFEPVYFGDLADAAAKGLAGLIAETAADYSRDELPVIRADGRQIQQLFQNLFSNALKFRGKDSPEIRVSAKRKDGLWQFSVADNGIGMDPAGSERIFDMFQRLHTSEEYPGNGIGLAICRSIVERHGGRIWAESTPGKGTVMHFTIADEDDVAPDDATD